MPKVSGPLMSVTAHGPLAQSLIFQRRGKGTIAKRYAIPSNPRTASQAGIRAMNYFLTHYWNSLSSSDKNSWAAIATQENFSPSTAFFRHNLNRWTTHLPPQSRPEPVLSTPYTTDFSASPTITKGSVSISISRTPYLSYVDIDFSETIPNPDCRGRYYYFEQYNSTPAFRRTSPSPLRLFRAPPFGFWIINTADSYTIKVNYWLKSSPRNGVYLPFGACSGSPLVGPDVYEYLQPTPPAYAICRFPQVVYGCRRQWVRAVIPADSNGLASWRDTNQIGLSPSHPPGVRTGNHFYSVFAFSLDGRISTNAVGFWANVP